MIIFLAIIVITACSGLTISYVMNDRLRKEVNKYKSAVENITKDSCDGVFNEVIAMKTEILQEDRGTTVRVEFNYGQTPPENEEDWYYEVTLPKVVEEMYDTYVHTLYEKLVLLDVEINCAREDLNINRRTIKVVEKVL